MKPDEIEQEIQMRIINDHQVNPANDLLVIAAEDAPGSGGANHRYAITGFDTAGTLALRMLTGIVRRFVEEAMHWLQQRTLERMRRGVEGTHAK